MAIIALEVDFSIGCGTFFRIPYVANDVLHVLNRMLDC